MQELVNSFSGLLENQGDFTTHVLTFFLVMARIMPLMFLTPVLGSRHAPQQVKVGLGIILSLIVYMPVYQSLPEAVPKQLAPFVLLMLKEFAIGILIGYVSSLIFWAVMMAGRMMDTAATRSMAEVQAPHLNARATPLGDIAYMYLLVLFFAVGGHRILIMGIIESFTKFGILDYALSTTAISNIVETEIRIVAQIFVIAVMVAAPVMVATFLSDVTFGLLNRVAPQLNAYFMSMPVKALGSIIILFIAWNTVSELMADYIIWILSKIRLIFNLFVVS